MLPYDWGTLYSVAEQLAVSRVPVPPPRSETSGIHGRPVALGSATAGELHTSSQIL